MGNEREPIRISLEKAKERYDEGDVSVLDVVDKGTYDTLSYQIKGAIRIAPEDVSDDYDRLPQDRSVLTY